MHRVLLIDDSEIIRRGVRALLREAGEWKVCGEADNGKDGAAFAVDLRPEVVAMDFTGDLGRLPEDCELSLFRIAQECLTNIHRHSGSFAAFVRVSRTPEKIEKEIRDEGRGNDQEIQARLNSGASVGVGLRGMKERARLLGGNLTVRSNGGGTSVLVVLPLVAEAAAKSAR